MGRLKTEGPAMPPAMPDDTGIADQRRNWLAAGGAVGAILASSCCILPLVLVTAGVSGAWIGNLTVLEPYRPWFAAFALVFIGLGFHLVYFKARPTCEDGSSCAQPQTARLTKSVLWLATLLVLAALTVDWWAPLFY